MGTAIEAHFGALISVSVASIAPLLAGGCAASLHFLFEDLPDFSMSTPGTACLAATQRAGKEAVLSESNQNEPP